MKITGVVKDKDNGEPLGGASVYVSDADGNVIGNGVTADQEGKFALDSAALNDPANYLATSHAGYREDVFMPDKAGFYTISLEPAGALDAFVFTGKRKAKAAVKKKTWMYWVGGAVVVAGIGFWIYKAKFAKKK